MIAHYNDSSIIIGDIIFDDPGAWHDGGSYDACVVGNEWPS
jgi:hypothetical protein